MESRTNICEKEKSLIFRTTFLNQRFLMLLVSGVLFAACQSGTRDQAATNSQAADSIKHPSAPPAHPSGVDIKEGKDVQTGLLAGEGLPLVKAHCTPCHSSKLITQNRFTRDGWHEKIVWMQHTQGLWDLGPNEDIILDYLAEHYAPEETGGRRQPLRNIDWYELKN